MIDLKMTRFLSDAETTLGVLRLAGDARWFTLEDQHRAAKIAGDTRIPPGSYRIHARAAGGMVRRYRARFAWHRGMLHLQSVPGFEWIYLHVGNTEADTAGCILVGQGARCDTMSLQASVDGYRAFYQEVIGAAEARRLAIQIIDADR